jgi:transcriptional regulator with XRE-family HTH domain
MTTVAPVRSRGVGDLLREWRQRRRLSQLDVATEAAVSARHLSFVETGRSKPSRELVLHLAEHLEVPLRERNTLLLAAGFAPVYRERSLEDEEMDPIRTALDRILTGHEPYPAVIVNRHWDLVAGNQAALALFTAGVAPELLLPPVNVYRLGLHPAGLAPRVRNRAEYTHHLLTRLQREVAVTADPTLAALLAEVRAYPGDGDHAPAGPLEASPAEMLFLPMEFTTVDGVELSFFSTLATFGTALDVTVAELSIEAFFPADDATRAYLQVAGRHAGSDTGSHPDSNSRSDIGRTP